MNDFNDIINELKELDEVSKKLSNYKDDFSDKTKGLNEGLNTLNDRINVLTKQIEKMQETLDVLNNEFVESLKHLDQDYGAIIVTFKNITDRLTNVEKKINSKD